MKPEAALRAARREVSPEVRQEARRAAPQEKVLQAALPVEQQEALRAVGLAGERP